MKLVFCNHCWFVYIDPAGTPGHDGRPVKLEACPQCFGNGGGKLLPVPAAVVAELVAPAVKAQVKTELLRRQYTEPCPTTFPIATTPPEPKTEDECRPE